MTLIATQLQTIQDQSHSNSSTAHPTIVLQEAILVTINKIAPNKQASADVSPIEPGTIPKRIIQSPSQALGICAHRVF